MTFRRWLDEAAHNHLRQLREILMTCALGPQKDNLIWAWENNKVFSVKPMYAHLCRGKMVTQIKEYGKQKSL